MDKKFRYNILLFVAIATITFGLSFIFNLIGRTFEFSTFWRFFMMVVASLLSALLITYIVFITTPILKEYLNTMRSLLRLDTFSHPILLKLQQNAPSSFHHSIMVANLGHRAAKAIGADALLVRIGGYYHDIGKTKDPMAFIENQTATEQEENIKKPIQLAKKIKSHVDEGISLAREYHLPQEVIDMIIQSHGTSQVSFIYKHLQQKGEKISKQDLAYKGPKPQTKEAGILMLADNVESRIRSIKELTEPQIIQIVDHIIQEKNTDRQLELSGITRGEMQKIKNAFIEGVKIIHHQRISYPK